MALSKDVYDINKFDGTNFAFWKEQIQDVLVYKKQHLPILYAIRTEEMNMTQLDWDELDALARSMIGYTLSSQFISQFWSVR